MQHAGGMLQQPVQKLVASLQLVPLEQVGHRVLYRRCSFVLLPDGLKPIWIQQPTGLLLAAGCTAATPYNLSLRDKLAVESYIVHLFRYRISKRAGVYPLPAQHHIKLYKFPKLFQKTS